MLSTFAGMVHQLWYKSSTERLILLRIIDVCVLHVFLQNETTYRFSLQKNIKTSVQQIENK